MMYFQADFHCGHLGPVTAGNLCRDMLKHLLLVGPMHSLAPVPPYVEALTTCPLRKKKQEKVDAAEPAAITL